jgi:hypothetical protein
MDSIEAWLLGSIFSVLGWLTQTSGHYTIALVSFSLSVAFYLRSFRR